VVLRGAIGKTSGMANPTQKRGAQQLFAANVRRIRLERKLTQERVAEAAGLHPNYISSVERGERNISICNIESIAFALGVSMSDLVTDYQPQEKKKPSQNKTG
jgi:transcriptional regulator with XRE-family HTH domain